MTTGISLMFLPSSEKDNVFVEQTENVHYSTIGGKEKWNIDEVGRGRACPTLGEGKEGAAHSDDQAVHPPRENIPPATSFIHQHIYHFIISLLSRTRNVSIFYSNSMHPK